MPVPLVLGIAACVRHVRLEKSWVAPMTAFVLAVPFLLVAWPDVPDESECAAGGFVPLSWGDVLEQEWLIVGTPLTALLTCVAGLGLLASPPRRPLATWLLAAGLTLAVTWFAAPVCVGA